MWEGLTVGGFQFDDSMEYALAKKEADIIQYISDRMDLRDPQVALKVYYKLLERKDFRTVVGLSFLKQLRDFCIDSGVAPDDAIKLIGIRNDKKGKLSSFGDENALEIDSAISESTADMENGFEKLDTKINEEFSETERELKRDIQNHISKENKFKGYGTDALMAIMRYVFDELGFHRLNASRLAVNQISAKMLGKCGFVEEGVKREYIYKGGKFIDLVEASILADEYYELINTNHYWESDIQK